jgi:choline-sulfatase
MLGPWLGRLATALRERRPGPAPQRPRPNVVWICADDFTPDACGVYGSRLARTPNLDRLASQGLRFDHAYCACPLSTPSRQAFWTGRYPRSIGVTLSRTPLPDDEVTLPTLLRQAGYEVAAFGKTHYYWPRRHEFDLSADFDDYEACLAAGQRTPPPLGAEVLGPWRPFADPAAAWLNAACLPYAACDADMFGTFLAGRAARYLGAARDRPFFLYVSFHETHAPFAFPVEFRGRHDPRAFRVPPVGAGDADLLPPVFRGLSEADKRGILAAYHTCAEYLDKNVGLVLDALDRSAAADNTLVLFTSDHGYLLGQHGRFEKHCCYEPAVRAALLMRLPGLIRPGGSTSAWVELIDLVPTILEVCGVALPGNVQGRSLVPLVRRQTASHRERIIVEYADNEEAMIRRGRWKLIYSTGRRERKDGFALGRPPGGPLVRLYDLEADPGEVTDISGRAGHAALVRDLTGELADHLVQTARDPGLVPRSSDPQVILGHCLAPRDVDLYAYLLNCLSAREVRR